MRGRGGKKADLLEGGDTSRRGGMGRACGALPAVGNGGEWLIPGGILRDMDYDKVTLTKRLGV